MARPNGKHVVIVCGTRPEAIKLAPVVHALAESDLQATLVSTGQHRQMLDPVFELFGLTPHHELSVMTAGQTLHGLGSAIVSQLGGLLDTLSPDVVLVHGDTTTAAAGALAAFYAKCPVGHVEAGLRTHDLSSPWPEEGNRRLVASLAHFHFAPTATAAANLAREGHDDASVIVTGNTVIDALQLVARRLDTDATLHATVTQELDFLAPDKRLILVTGHRRENFGDGLRNICIALRRLAERGDVQVVYPVHLNPQVRGPVSDLLQGTDNVRLVDPQGYLHFVELMRRAELIITDSGGIQEEAPALGKPVLVMRDSTERPEAVEAGTVRLVGSAPERIVTATCQLLDDPEEYARMASASNPFGDGTAARRIVRHLEQNL